jgi:hypothetical protein
MSTRRATDELWDALCALREPLLALSVTAWEDRPEHHDSMLADRLGDAVVEACGWLEGAIGAVREARDTGGDTATLRDALVVCSEQFDRVERSFWSEVASYERVDEIVVLGREQRRWSGWAAGVRRSVDEACTLIHDALAALLACWRELTGELGRSLVTVSATSVGQFTTTGKGDGDGQH